MSKRIEINQESVFAALTIYEPDKAFENAIKRGLNNPEDWMYMYSKGLKDYFKHHDTREYRPFLNLSNITDLKGNKTLLKSIFKYSIITILITILFYTLS